ncbi:MAG: hypothetical protein WCS27_09905 [Victivallaceae bacterium]
MRFKNFTILCIIWGISIAAQAEVYTLRSKGKSSGRDLDTFLPGVSLINEPVFINGAKAELKLSLVKIPISEILTLIKKLFPDARLAAGGGSLLVKQKLPDGRHKRLLLICFGKFCPVLQISMTVPPRLPKPSQWPENLAISSDGIPLRYMYFPRRESWYGTFKTAMEPAPALHEIRNSLTAQGWAPISGESSSRQQGRGEIFMRKKPLSLMLINFSDDGIATVFSRREK